MSSSNLWQQHMSGFVRGGRGGQNIKVIVSTSHGATRDGSMHNIRWGTSWVLYGRVDRHESGPSMITAKFMDLLQMSFLVQESRAIMIMVVAMGVWRLRVRAVRGKVGCGETRTKR